MGYLITDSNADIMISLSDQHLHRGELRDLVVLHRGAHRVLEQLKHDVVEVGRGIYKG